MCETRLGTVISYMGRRKKERKKRRKEHVKLKKTWTDKQQSYINKKRFLLLFLKKRYARRCDVIVEYRMGIGGRMGHFNVTLIFVKIFK